MLEAVHLDPHWKSGRNHPDNALLLRADLHALFDANLLSVDPDRLTVWVAESLAKTPYASFDGTALRTRADGSRPDRHALARRYRQATGRAGQVGASAVAAGASGS